MSGAKLKVSLVRYKENLPITILKLMLHEFECSWDPSRNKNFMYAFWG